MFQENLKERRRRRGKEKERVKDGVRLR